MKISFLGAGHMTAALGPGWLAAGHDVTVSGRSPAKAQGIADDIGARCTSLDLAAVDADAVILAVRYQGVASTLAAAGVQQLRDVVLVDVNNPVEVEGFTLDLPAGAPSLTAHLATTTGARVVKAFNLAQADVWRRAPLAYAGRPLVVPFAGDPAASEVVVELIECLGLQALDVGGIEHAAHLESAAAIVIKELFGGADPTTTLAVLATDSGGPGR